MTRWLNISSNFTTEHGVLDKHLHGQNRSINKEQTHSRENCSCEKRVWKHVCKRCYLDAQKKRASVPPWQNHPPHLLFSSCTVGVTQKPKWERVMEVLLHMLMVANPLSELFFPSFQQLSLAYLRRPCEHVVCETPFRLTWDIITGLPSVAPVAMNVCVCLCVGNDIPA